MRGSVGVRWSNVLDLGLLLNNLELDSGLHNLDVMHGLGFLNMMVMLLYWLNMMVMLLYWLGSLSITVGSALVAVRVRLRRLTIGIRLNLHSLSHGKDRGKSESPAEHNRNFSYNSCGFNLVFKSAYGSYKTFRFNRLSVII